MNIHLVEFNETFLEKSFLWLSDPNLRYLIMAKPITKEEQIEWYNSLPTKTDYIIRGIVYNGIPVGVAGIKHIDIARKNGETWVYIGDTKYYAKGIGKQTYNCLYEIARGIGLLSLQAKVREDNDRSLKFHLNEGFLIKSKEDEVILLQKFLEY